MVETKKSKMEEQAKQETTTSGKEKKIPFDTKNRAMPNVPPPIATPLSHDKLFKKRSDGEEILDAKALKEHLFGEGRLEKEDMIYIIDRATYLFTQEPNILKVWKFFFFFFRFTFFFFQRSKHL